MRPALHNLAAPLAFMALTGLLLYYLNYHTGIDILANDVALHVRFASSFAQGEAGLPANVGFYLVLLAVTGGSSDFATLPPCALCLLALAVGAKVAVSQWVSARLRGKEQISYSDAAVASVSAILFTIPNPLHWDNYYVGFLTPNVWHNSTHVAMMPFAVASFGLFWLMLEGRRPTTPVNLGWLTILILVGSLMKPSFLLVFIPVAGLAALYHHRFTASFWQLSVPLGFGILCIAAQFYAVKKFPVGVNIGDSETIFSFPAGWVKVRLPHISPWNAFYYLGSSLLMPGLYMLARPKALRWKPLAMAWGMMALGVLVFLCLMETTYRTVHYNYIWQCIAASYFLHLTTLISMSGHYTKHVPVPKRRAWLLTLSYAAVALMVVSGIAYLLRYALLETYY